MTAWLSIVGVGAGGVGDLAPEARRLLDGAETVLGPERLLDMLRAELAATPTPSSPSRGRETVGQRRAPSPLPLEGRVAAAGWGLPQAPYRPILVPWDSPLTAMLAQVEALRGTPTVILATGDPLWFGIGATLAERFAAAEFDVVPAVSALQLAAARMRWALQHIATISLHGRPVETLHPHLVPGNRVLALTSDRTTIAAVAALLIDRGYGGSRLTVLENLGGADERRSTSSAEAFDPAGIGDFHVLAIECRPDPGAPLLPPVAGLPDEAFAHDGQLSKREVRAVTLARLAPYAGARLWDVGAGCGSIAIEWLRAADDAKAIAFERDAGRRELIARNARSLGVPGLEIVGGEAPAALGGRPTPDAIFLGGDVANDALFDACWQAVRPGGRLVANAVTLDAEAALYARQDRLGGELVRIEVSVLDRIGGERVLRPRLAVTQWLVVKR